VFTGHALLAFALAVLIADWRGWPGRRALIVGMAAGAFAAVPDVDIAYAAVTLDVGAVAAHADPEAFWDATRGVHRTITHSLVVSVVAGGAFGLWAVRTRDPQLPLPFVGAVTLPRRLPRLVAIAALALLVVVAYGASGPAGGVVMGLFALAGVVVATTCATMTDLRPRILALAAIGGLVSHPWGDLVTGAPPGLFYPFELGILGERVLLHSDPTLHLLGAFAIELATVWLAAVAIVRVLGLSLPALVDRRALAGAAYGIAAVVLTPPTLSVSYQFVFSIIPIGVVCGGLSASSAGMRLSDPLRGAGPLSMFRWRHGHRRTALKHTLRIVLTALAGITVALVSYAVVYTLLRPL